MTTRIPYRAAVIGCGLIGNGFHRDAQKIGIYTHAGAYTSCPETTLCALCDPVPVALQEAGDQWGVAARYTDVAEMLSEARPEIVSICTPDASHAALLHQVLAFDSVRAVFAEKPLALNSMDARSIIASSAAKPILVNYSRRFAENHRNLKAALSAGLLGRVIAFRGCYTKGLLHNGTHLLDLAQWLVGPITHAHGFDSLKEKGSDPTLDARFDFANGATGTITGIPSENYSLFEADLFCSLGRAVLSDGGWQIEVTTPVSHARYSGYITLGGQRSLSGDLRDATLNGLLNLLEHLNNPRIPLACTAQNALSAMLTAEAIQRSARTGQRETVAVN